MNLFTISFALSTLFILLALYLIKIRKLEYRYGILWIIINFIIFLLSLNRKLAGKIANAVKFFDVQYLFIFLGIILVLILILYIITLITGMQKKIARLTQEIAIMNIVEKEEKKI